MKIYDIRKILVIKLIDKNDMVQMKIDNWYNWNDQTEMIWYEFVDARRKLDKIKTTLYAIRK